MKADLTLDDCNIISQSLRLKRDSLLRSRSKEITGSEMFSIFNRQIDALNIVENKIFSLVDGVAKS